MRKLCIFLALAAVTMGIEAKTIVVYFSATGTTKAAAQKIAKAQKATLWEIQPAEPYTAADLDWRNKQSRSSLEMNDQTVHQHHAVRHHLCGLPYLVGYLPADHQFVVGQQPAAAGGQDAYPLRHLRRFRHRAVRGVPPQDLPHSDMAGRQIIITIQHPDTHEKISPACHRRPADVLCRTNSR